MIAPRPSDRMSIAVLAALLPSVMLAQTTIKPSDVAGTWEVVTWKNLKTGAADSAVKYGVSWHQFTTSRWMIIQMANGRPVPAGESAKLSPAERVKADYAKVWDDKGNRAFAARGGNYRIEGNVVHTTRVLALQPATVGEDEAFTVTHLDQNTLVFRTEPDDQGVAFEITLRRLQ